MQEDKEKLSDMKSLTNFLLDIECLEPLKEWTSKFNLFDILKITRTEIRHSNMLAWLLDPNENHGFGDSILGGVMQYAVEVFAKAEDIIEDYSGFEILREWRNIDILAVSESQKFVLCIENKIYSGEHDDQLNRYRNIVDKTFPGYKRAFIFLSPNGRMSSDPENWCSMGYRDILDIIENARRKTNILPEAALLIDNYTEAVRRDIVGDEKLAQLCADIYKKHKQALDLIFENKPDVVSNISAMFCEWAQQKAKNGEIEFVPDNCAKSYVRFKTAKMSELMPDAKSALSGWNTHNYYFYEINIDENGFRMQLAMNSKGIPDDLRAVCDKIIKHTTSRAIKDTWQWRIAFATKYTKFNEDCSEEHLFELADKHFKEMMKMETELIQEMNTEGVGSV